MAVRGFVRAETDGRHRSLDDLYESGLVGAGVTVSPAETVLIDVSYQKAVVLKDRHISSVQYVGNLQKEFVAWRDCPEKYTNPGSRFHRQLSRRDCG